MILAEILKFTVDINLMRTTLNKIQQEYKPIWQGSEFGYNNFGGWSLQSRNGSYRENWEMGIEFCTNKYGVINYNLAKYLNISHPFEIVNPTEVCIGPFNDFINTLTNLNFYPRRARITVLKAHSKSIVHCDSPSGKYMHRIHVPLITNDKCIHWTEKGAFHMPADGSVYMLPVNIMHQIINDSDEDRYHIIVDAYDTKHITQNYNYFEDINVLINRAVEYRKSIDLISNNILRSTFYSICKTIGSSIHKYQINNRKGKV